MNFLSAIISGIISPVTNLLGAYLNKKQDVDLEKFKVDGTVDVSLIQAQVAIFQAQAQLAQSKVMQALYVIFSLPLAFHMGKVYIWDADLHLGTSDAVSGDVATWAMWIVGFIFFHSSITAWNRKT